MGLGRTTNANFHSDKEQAQRLAKASLEFIWNNYDAFRKKANSRQINDFHDFCNMARNKEPFSDGQCSYIDDLYEKTMLGLGLPSYRSMKSKYGVNLKV